MSHQLRFSPLLLLLAGLLIGCEPESAGPLEASEAPRDAVPALRGAPREHTRTVVASMLRAHHPEDLPSRAAIEAHPGGVDALRWLAEHHGLQGVRARALLALGMFPEDESATVLRRVLSDPESSPGLRAASTRALAGWDLSARAELRALAVESLHSDALAVAVAGAEVLREVPEVQDVLAVRRTTAAGALRRVLTPVAH